MSEKRRIDERLADIVLWGEKLDRYVSEMPLDVFIENEMAVDASMKCIEVLGEASSAILRKAPEFESRYPELALRKASQARNRLSHGYFDVNQERVWQTARSSVRELVAAAKKVLGEMKSSDGHDL